MDTPFYKVCKADPTVQSLLGGTEPRIYPFSEAPQDVAKPYVVYQWVGGNPFSTLNCRPQSDRAELQVDVYALTQKSSTDCAKAIRYAIELDSHLGTYRGTDREEDTKLWRTGFDVTWLVDR